VKWSVSVSSFIKIYAAERAPHARKQLQENTRKGVQQRERGVQQSVLNTWT
jgi:hypothetical protein